MSNCCRRSYPPSHRGKDEANILAEEAEASRMFYDTHVACFFSPSFLGASFFDFAGHENLSEAQTRASDPHRLSLLTFEQDKFTSSLLAEQKESGGRGRDRSAFLLISLCATWPSRWFAALAATFPPKTRRRLSEEEGWMLHAPGNGSHGWLVGIARGGGF